MSHETLATAPDRTTAIINALWVPDQEARATEARSNERRALEYKRWEARTKAMCGPLTTQRTLSEAEWYDLHNKLDADCWECSSTRSSADVTVLKTTIATLTANDVKQQEQLAQQQAQLEALAKQMESLKRQATRMESLMGDFTLGW